MISYDISDIIEVFTFEKKKHFNMRCVTCIELGMSHHREGMPKVALLWLCCFIFIY
jgi:hypothetical protein